jgi:glutathione S-transferase
LAAKYDGGLQPKSLEERALATQWSFWAMTETEKALLELLFHSAILPEDQRNPEARDIAVQALAPPFKVLDQALTGREQLVSDGFSVADLNVASVLSWVRLARHDLSDYPQIDRWLGACLDRPAAQAAMKA